MTKRKVLIWGGVFNVVYVGLYFLWMSDLCGSSGFLGRGCSDVLTFIETSFVSLIPLLLLSLLTYKMREEVFQAWWGFTRWFLPLSIFLILIMPGGQGGGFGVPSVFDREFLAFILATLFFLVSLGIIARKSLKLRGMRKG